MMVLSSVISSDVTGAIVEICAIHSESQIGKDKKEKTPRRNHPGKAAIYGRCLVRGMLIGVILQKSFRIPLCYRYSARWQIRWQMDSCK